jgi:hypothetical protein
MPSSATVCALPASEAEALHKNARLGDFCRKHNIAIRTAPAVNPDWRIVRVEAEDPDLVMFARGYALAIAGL